MTDLVTVVPDLTASSFSNIIPSLERNNITCSDLLTLDAVDIAKHAQLPARDVRRLAAAILDTLHASLDPGASRENPATPAAVQRKVLKSTGRDLQHTWNTIGILDRGLDAALGGGFPVGYLSEVTGESGTAKTTLLLHTLLSAQLCPSSHLKSTLYISTESPLPTARLTQILSTHPALSAIPAPRRPTLANILSIQTPDLESQFHILRYQLPIAIRRNGVVLVIIDSITSNFRAEYERRDAGRAGPEQMAKRSAQLTEMAALLREIARKEHVAIVVANQVADRFETGVQAPQNSTMVSQRSQSSTGGLSQMREDENAEGHEPLTLDHQQRWFTGWGDVAGVSEGLKTPSLGLVWTNQIACRVALTRERRSGRRRMKVVFASWARDSAGEKGVRFKIGDSGVRGVDEED